MEMKRVLSALLCAVMLMTSVTVLAATNEATPGEATRCEHVNGTTVPEQRDVTYAQDAATHTMSYNLVVVHTCPDCEAGNYQEDPVPTTDPAEAHSFLNGVCSTCEYTCQHATHNSDGACTICGQACAHSFANGACTVCGMVCAHSFVNGTCTVCGKSECGHTGLTTTELVKNRRITGYDERYHYLVYDLYVADYCGICQKIVGEPTLKQADCANKEQHFTLEGETACYHCGYDMSSCTHEATEEQVYRSAVEVLSSDQNNHTVKADVFKDIVCRDCGESLGVEKLEEGIVVTEPHGEFVWNGVCQICQYQVVSDCRHPETEDHNSFVEAEVISKDENGHTVRGAERTQKVCKSCGILVETIHGEEQVITEPHSYYLDRCMVCNDKNPCKHEQTHTETVYVMTYDYKAAENGHTFKGCELEQEWCDVCESMISEKTIEANGTYTEPHYFEGGVCALCGMKEPEATATPTAEPTATPAPTAAPVEEPDNDFVPTPRPNRVNTAAASTPEPVVEPTAAPTAAPMVDTLLSAVTEAETEGSNVTIEVVGAQEIMTETEYTSLKALPAQEQILVTLASIGFEDVVEAATKAMEVELSEDAQTLVTQVTERMAAVSEEERAAVEEKLAKYFPVEEVEIDGVRTSYFVIDLRIEVDGVARVERYGFRLDENGEWIFERLDLQSVEW